MQCKADVGLVNAVIMSSIQSCLRSKRKAECNLREKAMKRMRAVESDSVKSAQDG